MQSQEAKTLMENIRSTIVNLFSAASNDVDDDGTMTANVNNFLINFSVPLAHQISSSSSLDTATSSASEEWMKNILRIVSEQCDSIFETVSNKTIMQQQNSAGSSSSSSSTIIVPIIFDELLYIRFLRVTNFLSALCFHLEQDLHPSNQFHAVSCAPILTSKQQKNDNDDDENDEQDEKLYSLRENLSKIWIRKIFRISNQKEMQNFVASAVIATIDKIFSVLNFQQQQQESEATTTTTNEEKNANKLPLLAKYLQLISSKEKSKNGIKTQLLLLKEEEETRSMTTIMRKSRCDFIPQIISIRSAIESFGLLSGFRKALVSKIRRELPKRMSFFSSESSSPSSSSSSTSSLPDCRGTDLALKLYQRMNKMKLVTDFILPITSTTTTRHHNNNKEYNFENLNNNNSEERKNNKLVSSVVLYGSSSDVLLKTIKRVSLLGNCDSVDSDAVSNAVADMILRDKDSGIDRAVLKSLSNNDNDSDTKLNKSIPWIMVQIAGEEAVAKILARRIQTNLAAVLEKLRVQETQKISSLASANAKEQEQEQNVSSFVNTCLLPWFRFVLCDGCFKDQQKQQHQRHRSAAASSSPSSCVYRQCCSNHTLIASAVREGIRAVFTMTRFEAFVTKKLLLEFHNTISTSSTTDFTCHLFRILQGITTLPTHYQSEDEKKNGIIINTNMTASSSAGSTDNNNNNNSASNNMATTTSVVISWPYYFHHLAFQRILDKSSSFDVELKCAECMLQAALCDADTVFYPRKYKGMIQSILAGQKLVVEDNSSLFLLPRHFSPGEAFYCSPLSASSALAQNNSMMMVFDVLSQNNNLSFIWSPPIQRQLQQQFQNRILSTAPSTRLTWLPNDGICKARVSNKSSAAAVTSIVVSGSPLQIACLYEIGNAKTERDDSSSVAVVTVESLTIRLFEQGGSNNNGDFSVAKNPVAARLIDDAVDALKQAGLVITTTQKGNNNSLQLVPIQERNSCELILSSSSLFAKPRSTFIATALDARITKVAEDLAAVMRSRQQQQRTSASAATTSNNNNVDNELEALAQRTRSNSRDRGNGGEHHQQQQINLVSTLVIKTHALRVIKRAGKISLSVWSDATKQLVKYNFSSSQFEKVVNQLIEGEFCSEVSVAANNDNNNNGEQQLLQQKQKEYEYLP